MDGFTVDIQSEQAEDLDIDTTLPGWFARSPEGFTVVIENPLHLPRGLAPGRLQGGMELVRIRSRGGRRASGMVRVHSVKWRHGPGRILDRTPVTLEAIADVRFPPRLSLIAGNESGTPAQVRLESDAFDLDTAPVDLAGSDLKRIDARVQGVERLGVGVHEGMVLLVPADSRAVWSEPATEEVPVRMVRYVIESGDIGEVSLPPGALRLRDGAVRGPDGSDVVLDVPPGGLEWNCRSWSVDYRVGRALLGLSRWTRRPGATPSAAANESGSGSGSPSPSRSRASPCSTCRSGRGAYGWSGGI